jgi:malonate-semialdehyde dehydrogenase (acetylating) / methylmalonate-semialdehyde dehydrogenase
VTVGEAQKTFTDEIATVAQSRIVGSGLDQAVQMGPVISTQSKRRIDDAISLINRGQYGNMACLFTTSGAAARKFRFEAEAGNIGINIGVAAPTAFFPFSGWKDSFFGNLHGQGHHAVEFFTQTKVVVERGPQDWSRQF